ncbi:MAG: hypothetical protein ACOYXR_13350 [Nitrospirota bacterium]
MQQIQWDALGGGGEKGWNQSGADLLWIRQSDCTECRGDHSASQHIVNGLG